MDKPRWRGIRDKVQFDHTLPEQQIGTGYPGTQPFGNETLENPVGLLGWVLPRQFARHRDPIRLDFDCHRDADRVRTRVVFEPHLGDSADSDPAQLDWCPDANAAERIRKEEAVGDPHAFGSFFGSLAVRVELKGRTRGAWRPAERRLGGIEYDAAGDQRQQRLGADLQSL